MKPFKAIAAMSTNRVIGKNNMIPWHVPDDLAFFKHMTWGHILLMGSKTYESIGRPLPGRQTVVLTRQPDRFGHIAGVKAITELSELDALELDPTKDVFIAGGGMLYGSALHLCSDLYLTHIKKIVDDGDTFFPSFEDLFEKKAVLQENNDYTIIHYSNTKIKLLNQPS